MPPCAATIRAVPVVARAALVSPRSDVFVSDNAGPFQLWLDDTTDDSAVYAGAPNHTYRFYAVATDNVGHVQSTSGTAQAQTTVTNPGHNATRASEHAA